MAGNERRFVISVVGEDRGGSEMLRRTGDEAEKLGKRAKSSSASTGALIGSLGGGVPTAAGRATGAIGQVSDGLSDATRNATIFAGAGAGAALIKLGGDAIKASSDLRTQTDLTKKTFTTSSESVLAWSKTTTDALGISQVAALEAANTFGGMFTNLGFGAQKAADMSQAAVQLGGDLASLKGIGTAEALKQIESALSGNEGAFDSAGIALDEATVKSRGLADGLANSKGELSETAKVATRYQIVLEGLKGAQGDAAKNADQFANSQRRAMAQLEDAKAKHGSTFMDAANELLEIGQAVADAGKKAGDWIGEADKKLAKFLGIKQTDNNNVVAIDKTASATDRAAQAAQVYARVVLDGKKNTDEGRAAKAAYVTEVKAAEAAEGELSEELKTEAQRMADAARATKEREQGLDDAEDSVYALAAAQRTMTEATEAVAEADEGVTKAQAELNRLRREGAVDAEDVARASESLASASKSVADAREAEAEAEKDLAKAREGASAFDLEGAGLSVEAANLAKVRSADRLAEAERAVADAIAEGLPAYEIAELELDVAEARLANKQAARAQEDAERSLYEMRQQGTAGDERVIEAEKRVKDARDRVAEATGARGKAEAELRLAQAGDPAFAQTLADAADKVTLAQDRAKDARWRAAEAAIGLQGAAEKEAAALAATGGAADEVARRIDHLIRQHPQLASVLGTVRALLGSAGALPAAGPGGGGAPGRGSSNLIPRAAGGELEPGQGYLINEGAQTEVFTTGGARARMTPVGAMGGVTFNASIVLNASGVSDPDALVRQFGPKIMDWLRKESRRSGGLGFEDPLGR